MLQRKSVAIALAMVLSLAVAAPSFASPVGSDRVSIVDSVMAWFGQVAEYLGIRAAIEDAGGFYEPGGTPQASTDESGVFGEPGGVARPSATDDPPRILNFGDENPPSGDEGGVFVEPGG